MRDACDIAERVPSVPIAGNARRLICRSGSAWQLLGVCVAAIGVAPKTHGKRTESARSYLRNARCLHETHGNCFVHWHDISILSLGNCSGIARGYDMWERNIGMTLIPMTNPMPGSDSQSDDIPMHSPIWDSGFRVQTFLESNILFKLQV